MDKSEFELLLGRAEGTSIDFKMKSYDFSLREKQDDFAKDVLCMANTPRDETSYIVMGVKKFDDHSYDLNGLDSYPDDADLQTYVSNRLSPVPQFSYESVGYEEKTFGVISIPVRKTGPFLPVDDFGEKLKKGQVYFRRGSKNDIAKPEEIAQIYAWMENSQQTDGADIDTWDNFLESVNKFDPSQKYILIVSKTESSTLNIESLGKVPWLMVLDFDPESDSTGLLSRIAPTIEERRSLHQVVVGERPSLLTDRSVYWFYARGLLGRDTSLQLGDFKSWAKTYVREISSQLERLAAEVNPSPITCVVIWAEPDLRRHLQSALVSALSVFGDSLTMTIISEYVGSLETIASEVGAEFFEMPLRDLCSGIEFEFADEDLDTETCVLPTSTGAPVTIDSKDFLWLREELEVVHKNAGKQPELDRIIGVDFLRGSEISWYELSNHWDVDRDKASKIKRLVKSELGKKRSVRINLFHAPGAGGTTLARRLLWEFHDEYPCVVLTRCEPAVTIERLYKLSSLTGRPILLLIDSSQIEERQIDDLFTLVRSRLMPIVVLQTLRRFALQEERERSFYLESRLSRSEARRLADKLILVKPERENVIEKMVSSNDEKNQSPFFFGLQTFEKDFVGIRTYIKNKLSTLNPLQSKILCFIAVSHHYAQRPIRSQAFAAMLGVPRSRPVKLSKYIPESCHDLLVESFEEAWRTAHDLLAVEILEQVISGANEDTRVWRQQLSSWANDFLAFCRGDDTVASEDMLEIVRRTFIFRDNTDVLGTERSGTKTFAELLDDIPSKEGRLEVLKSLVELYPDEAHFWSHLGRYYSLEMQNFAEALKCAEKAISLEGNDPLLHHMHGMILRNRISILIENRGEVDDMIGIGTEASAAFEMSRKLNPNDEHGYISEVQMLISMLDYAGRSDPNGVMGYLARPTSSLYLREALQRAEDLLEQVRRNREGEGASPYEQNSRARLSSLYGKHDYALQVWNNLLSRSDTFHPPLRRQIVWTYLVRRDRSWLKLDSHEINRILDLLNENIEEDPSNERDLRLWIQCIRRVQNPPSLESTIERMSYWRANSGSLDSVYYLYVLYTLLAMSGSGIAKDDAERFIKESKQLSSFRRNRTKSFEWYGAGTTVDRLVHQSELGEWDKTRDFWESTDRLVRVTGRIASIEGPQAGKISIPGGLNAFFVPSRSNHIANRSENKLVDFYLGFSYDGLRAWEVVDVVGTS